MQTYRAASRSGGSSRAPRRSQQKRTRKLKREGTQHVSKTHPTAKRKSFPVNRRVRLATACDQDLKDESGKQESRKKRCGARWPLLDKSGPIPPLFRSPPASRTSFSCFPAFH